MSDVQDNAESQCLWSWANSLQKTIKMEPFKAKGSLQIIERLYVKMHKLLITSWYTPKARLALLFEQQLALGFPSLLWPPLPAPTPIVRWSTAHGAGELTVQDAPVGVVQQGNLQLGGAAEGDTLWHVALGLHYCATHSPHWCTAAHGAFDPCPL